MVIVPQTHDQHHRPGNRRTKLRKPALVRRNIRVAERHLLGLAEFGSKRITRVAGNGRFRVGDRLAVLHVEALDFGELTVGGAFGEELRDDGEFLVGVDGKHARTRTVEIADALPVRVEVAAVRVAGARVAVVGRVSAAAQVAFAPVLADGGARVRGEGNELDHPNDYYDKLPPREPEEEFEPPE